MIPIHRFMEQEDFNSVSSKDDGPDALKEAAGASENLLVCVAGQVLDAAVAETMEAWRW